VGIILCSDKREVEVEYALAGLSSNIFASKYSYVLPDKEKLIAALSELRNKYCSAFSFVSRTPQTWKQKLLKLGNKSPIFLAFQIPHFLHLRFHIFSIWSPTFFTFPVDFF